jgi:phosphatidylcholine synthase
MLVSSAFGFSQAAAKTSDYFFTGFPSYWNIVVFYLLVLGMSQFVNAVVLIALALLVFVPIAYVYPSRTPVLRALTVPLGIVWAALMLVMIWEFPSVSRVVLYPSFVFPSYYLVVSFVLHRRRHVRPLSPQERTAANQ